MLFCETCFFPVRFFTSWKLHVCVFIPLFKKTHRAKATRSLWQQSPVDMAWFGCHSELTWMCRLLFLAIAPSCPSKAPVQVGAKRGVTTGFTRGYCQNQQKQVESERILKSIYFFSPAYDFFNPSLKFCARYIKESYLFVQELCDEPWGNKTIVAIHSRQPHSQVSKGPNVQQQIKQLYKLHLHGIMIVNMSV